MRIIRSHILYLQTNILFQKFIFKVILEFFIQTTDIKCFL